MLEFLGGLATSVLGGGITGILGVIVQRFADYKNKELDLEIEGQKFQHELDLRKVDAEIQAEEWASRTQVAQIEATGKAEVSADQAFAASFNESVRFSDPSRATPAQTWLLVILDFIRGIVRPGLTLYLCVLTTLVYFSSQRVLAQNPISAAEAVKLVHTVIEAVLYLTTTCTLHWFGTRNHQPGPKLGR